MSLTINTNLMASNAARNLSNAYGALSTSIERMSTGLRINSAADDAAGMAIREMMRTEIATTQQGIRNAADAISLIQTADGALAVIDEKLTRMKELAEQAATGTYTTLQREIINSEYQAMAAEIDRIANSTEFNGVKLLDGSISNQHGGQGLKIHFGTGNSEAEDYYFINTGDARATSSTGLRVGGDAKNDIWGQGAAGSVDSGAGCCTAGFPSLNGVAGFTSGQSFSFGYNWDWTENDDPDLLSGKYLAGRYTVNSSDSLQDLIDKVNLGTQSRAAIEIDGASLYNQIAANGAASGASLAVCVGDEAYVFGDMDAAKGYSAQNVTADYSGLDGYATYRTHMWTSAAAQFTAAGIDVSPLDGALTGEAQEKTFASAKSAASEALDAAISAFNANSALVPTRLTLTTSAGSGVTGTVTGAALAADGESKSFLTGVYVDDNGNFTTSAALGAAMGFTQIEAIVTGTANTSGEIMIANVVYKMGDRTITTVTPAAATSATAAKVETAVEGDVDTAIKVLQASTTATGMGQVNAAAANLVAPAQAANNTNYNSHDVWVGGMVDATKSFTQVATSASSATLFTAESLASAINNNEDSEFWAMLDEEGGNVVYVFHKEGGNHNDIKVCEVASDDSFSRTALDSVRFQNVETGEWNESGTSMSLGGEHWATMNPVLSKVKNGAEVWNVTLDGRDVGAERDLWISDNGELVLPGIDDSIINSMDRSSFVEIQNAANGQWAGAEVRTQSSAQEALEAIDTAVTNKDKLRADLGALQNRLENTITNLEIQNENLQASESRISDVDVATEMTEFTKNNVLVQAATSMLAQANSMSQMALSLLG